MHQMIVCPHGPQAIRNSEADLIELTSGRLLLVWTQFYGGFADHAAARLSGRVSDDGGCTWSAPFTVVGNPGGCNVMSVSMVRNRAGHILLFYLWKKTTEDCQVLMRRSVDEGQTWGEPVSVSSRPGYHVMNNARVVSVGSGRLLAPVAHDNQVYCYISDDDGESWRAGKQGAQMAGSRVMEPGLVELRDGRVLMVIRTELGKIYKSYSPDLGDSWSVPQPTPLVSPSSPSTVARIPSTNDLLIVWNNQPLGAKATWAQRTPLTAAVSRDEGETWENSKNIERDPGYGFAYTSVTFVRELTYLTYYSWRHGARGFENTNLKLSIMPQSWFYEPQEECIEEGERSV